jgi:hypothetical protein
MPDGMLGGRGALPGSLVLGNYPLTIEDAIKALPGLVLHYTFDDPTGSTTVVDYAGARPGTYNGSPTLQAVGPSSAAATFGVSDYAVSTGSPINLATGAVSFWFKLNALPPTVNGLILGLFDSSSVFR